MRDRLLEVSGAEVELIEGAGGAFEVTRDGALVFSKKQVHRFPEETELDEIVTGS